MVHIRNVRKADGSLEPFQDEKLRASLQYSGVTERTIDEVLRAIEKHPGDIISSQTIYEKALGVLKTNTKAAVARYSLKRAVFELGPTGFPFEDFIAEVLKRVGYTVATRQMVRGKCVEHELDIVASKENRRIGAELKFHNSPGMKTDVKVALYVAARFIDIESASAADGHNNQLSERWLLTNTSYTSQAIAYGTCAGLTLIGWNYPEQGNLHDIIQSSGTHPITCLSQLTRSQKQQLLSKGHVLCRNISDEPTLLSELGIVDKKTDAVLAEVYDVCAIDT